MPKDLRGRTIALVKATVPALGAHGLAVTRRMYARMFQNEAIRDNGATHAMGARAREPAAGSNGSIKAATFYERPRPEDRRGRAYDEEGLISVEWLSRNTPMQEADYFLCGPRPCLRSFVGGLAQEGVASGRIHYEFFGPADELLAA